MRIRSVRCLPAAVAVAAIVTGTLAWAPTASAQSPEPTPSNSTAPAPRAAEDTGGIAILKKDPAGDVLSGATFSLLDSAGKEAANGTTNADGQLVFKDLTPGVYRLKEDSSGSKLHDTVEDQDVIVTPGTAAPLTIIDPFKPASLLLQAKDDKSGKLLPGATVNIGTGDKTLLTLTTGDKGTATAQLPVNNRTSTDFWAKQTNAPDGYDLSTPSKTFTAKPGTPVTVTVTNAKTSTTEQPTEQPTDKPTEQSTDKPTEQPTDKSTPDQPEGDEDTSSPSASPSGTPSIDETTSSTAAPANGGTLAHTGADATPWLIGGAALLLTAGGIAVFVARRRTQGKSDDGTAES
ncbi:SpaA isopeptide-forming pilin-related protein [Streptomyces sp. CT34]|uniref:SpaA isopeptide-forming pilin-related protein n=1 Tax=Streptomyces sp. CT34 TaxID=1553907 RepID=UPI0005BB9B56|nr:SpaA isopeptide-forming pilin-related protein [Streptomyces sp. CT34]